MKTVKVAAIGLASLFVSSTALAQAGNVENIGNTGQFVFGVDRVTGFGFHHLTNRMTVTTPNAFPPGSFTIVTQNTRDTYTQVSFLGSDSGPVIEPGGGVTRNTGFNSPVLIPRVSFDYLPFYGLTVGGSLMVLHQGGETKAGPFADNKFETRSTMFFLEPRVGYALAFNNIVGLWPRAGFEWYHATASAKSVPRAPGDAIDKNWSRGDLYQLALEVMLVLSPFQHVAILVGPYADIGLGGSGRAFSSTMSPAGVTVINPSVEQHPLLNSFGLTSSLVAYFP